MLQCRTCGTWPRFGYANGMRPEGLPNQEGVIFLTQQTPGRRWHSSASCMALQHGGRERHFDGYFACRMCVPYAPVPPRP